ncbi:hypothetical protein [Cyanobium sp. NIES-981]|uniref:hypothetical protein n=1 Tax=Cyanobium sp. NIES-981 TaxID=1851505 RepID=UPI0007DD1452|nr:hypothetical protein [Cyanobium sp. NIES-981]SBO44883.1 protein of unknown function [Cyanobium sp. NIES-981]
MLNSVSGLTQALTALPRDAGGEDSALPRITVILFLRRQDQAAAALSLASLEVQHLQPSNVLLVSPPQPDAQEEPARHLAGAARLTRCTLVSYGELAQTLLRDAADALVFLHAGTCAHPFRLDHDARMLQRHPAAGVLTLPILHAAAGDYPSVPPLPFPEDRIPGQPPQLAGRDLLSGGGGVADSPWLLDCLTLRAAQLREQLMPGDLSILPALHRCLQQAGPILVLERCLTTCPLRLDGQG